MAKAILLTGAPGCGKTTLIRNVINRLPGPIGGFYTQEIREGRIRKGFEIITLDGKRGTLAHVKVRSKVKVSKYGVDINTLDALAVTAIQEAISQGGIVIIDEIGPMEIKSSRFRHTVLKALESNVTVLGTIVKRDTSFANQIKSRPDVTLIEVDFGNRDSLVDHLLGELQKSPS